MGRDGTYDDFVWDKGLDDEEREEDAYATAAYYYNR